MTQNRSSYWGLSMYGGYYADVYVNDEHRCLHADKLRELKAQLAELGLELDKELRWDN